MHLFLILSLGLLVQGDEFSSEWKQWKELHGKEYSSNEVESLRYKIFQENSRKIQKHNEEERQGLHTFTLGMNHFGDLLQSEIVESFSGLSGKSARKNVVKFDINTQVPSSVNWTAKGAVTPVKDQGNCKSSWAFSTTGSIESQIFIHKKKLISLSEQQLVDCSGSFGNVGCDGGIIDTAFLYIIGTKGIESENGYPYTAKDGHCNYNKSLSVASISSFKDIPHGDENQLKVAVGSVGPVAVSIDASSHKFHFYKSGVLVDDECTTVFINNAALAVGYGKDKKSGLDYWIVKNSWTAQWGDNGYVLLARNKNNMCGIASEASYPII